MTMTPTLSFQFFCMSVKYLVYLLIFFKIIYIFCNPFLFILHMRLFFFVIQTDFTTKNIWNLPPFNINYNFFDRHKDEQKLYTKKIAPQ